ncbi:hypothetical protein GCM10023200_45070 [Actinomycetospora chlora]|uniref:Uncharacterized protein n=1 Tax=Actinomycetospora chlora TaxID=663608 RepID=A0ABP9BZR0_9PSEU
MLGRPVTQLLVGRDVTVGVVGGAHGTTSGLSFGVRRAGPLVDAAPCPPIGFGAPTSMAGDAPNGPRTLLSPQGGNRG